MKADDAIERLRADGSTATTFPDGAQFRIEIPSVEGPRVLEEVVRAAEAEGIVVNRVSQGSGAMLLREAELRELAEIGAAAGMEVSLFVGPREGYDVGAHARSAEGAAQAGQLRGLRGLRYAAEDVSRAAECGIRSFLIADTGLLRLLTEMQGAGELPAEIVWKISVLLAPSNPLALRELEHLGASDGMFTVEQLAELRAATALPLDLYVESPDGLGGVVRGDELGELVKAGAPLYAKFGLRNARMIYPAGAHLLDEARAIAREKVHRAAAALEWLDRLSPELVQSGAGAPGLGVPRPAAEAVPG